MNYNFVEYAYKEMGQPSIAAIVLNYNRAKYFQVDCFKVLRVHTHRDFLSPYDPARCSILEKIFYYVILAPIKNISNKSYNYVLPTTWSYSYTKMNPPKNFSAIFAVWMRQYKSAQPACTMFSHWLLFCLMRKNDRFFRGHFAAV